MFVSFCFGGTYLDIHILGNFPNALTLNKAQNELKIKIFFDGLRPGWSIFKYDELASRSFKDLISYPVFRLKSWQKKPFFNNQISC